MSTSTARAEPVDLATERAALDRAKVAVEAKLERLAGISGGGADALTDAYIDAVVASTIDKLQHELVVFGRIDDEHAWRVGLYGIDSGGEQLVIDWRAPFAGKFYQASFDDPLTLVRRVSYVGCIDDLLVEDFASGSVEGSSPLMTELSRSRGASMRAAVATLQSEQDRLVRLDPEHRLVLRGGPGTGKTVVGLHRAAWLVYNDHRVTAERILVIGPSDRFLRFVSAVLPTLGEAKITQTTFDRLLGPSGHHGLDEAWLAQIDELEAGLCTPADLRVRGVRIPIEAVTELIERLVPRPLPWRERRKIFLEVLASRFEVPRADLAKAAADVFPACTTKQALARLRRTGIDTTDGGVVDEVRARFEGVPARYAHVIVDEAQDMGLLQLRAVMRRATGVTLVGDDAQRSAPDGLGLRRAAVLLDTELEHMATAYRMSAEIADWLNAWADAHAIDAVRLDGIRPTGVAVREVHGDAALVGVVADELRTRWPNVMVIGADDVWSHKGVEYDAVVVDRRDLPASEVYLAASRAAHELVVVHHAGDRAG